MFSAGIALPVPGPVNLPCRRSGHVIILGDSLSAGYRMSASAAWPAC